ncbi:hypothetical protein PGN35_016835 [Nodosilinea sp. PGN35]|uniref:hypothetical protein n=1 Tax=Nodosilinea sp. PGN35 TaxID=3020489 RepID=UPI0023B2699F|nr:hypothetical protein [Nodosilinea sp. TSF1-S3]MDF0369505.1 hypothetical protein [Nodosilinea sp. TSF1-S3]
MGFNFVVQDSAIAIAAADLNPAMLNLDILRYSGVVPADWELSRAPVYTPRAAQIFFENGINIVAEGNQVVIVEPLEGDLDLQAPRLAQQYVRAFPKLQYQGFTTNLRGYLPTDYPAGRYVCDTWLAPGPWQEGCARAALNLIYKGDRAPLQLALTEAMLQTKQGETIPIVLFGGRYGYAVQSENVEENCDYLTSCFGHIREDVEHYTNTVNQKFIQPSLRLMREAQPQRVLSTVS